MLSNSNDSDEVSNQRKVLAKKVSVGSAEGSRLRAISDVQSSVEYVRQRKVSSLPTKVPSLERQVLYTFFGSDFKVYTF